jgi:hypothetical protein
MLTNGTLADIFRLRFFNWTGRVGLSKEFDLVSLYDQGAAADLE